MSNEIAFTPDVSMEAATRADFIYKITPNTITITDTTLGKLSVTEDINAVLGKIEHWHQGSIAAFKINANLITGLNLSFGVALSGNTLWVADFSGGRVGGYNATTGVAINATETGSVTTLGGVASVTFTRSFSQVPIVTCSANPSALATVVSTTTAGFTVNTVDSSTKLPNSATVTWSAVGGTGGITNGKRGTGQLSNIYRYQSG
jgi:hypothetical protein